MGNGIAQRSGTALVLSAALGLMPLAAAADCAENSVDVRSPTGAIARFSVVIADDGAERATGLMNRPSMASSEGMLFVYETPRRAMFWMKNTLIPLDMIFADATGTVTSVHENAVPMDETSIDGGEGVTFVLEINGGLSGRLGIVPGSVFRSPLIAQKDAAWACSDQG